MTAVMQGVRVLEVAEHTFVPAASALLADWGAEVIKIEHVERGDAMRGLASTGVLNMPSDVHVLLEHSNRGKQSLGLDLTTDEGLDVVHRLAATCDVFLTNKLPRVRQKLKIDLVDIRAHNPDIIYVRGTGQGEHGPDADKGSYDALAFWNRAGMGMALARPEYGHVPGPPAPGYGDSIGAMTIAGGIMGALFHRERTGQATTVDVSLLGTGIWAMGQAMALSMALGTPWVQVRGGRNGTNPLSRNYQTKDGHWLALTCLQAGKYWPPLCEILGRSDLVADPRFADHASLNRNCDDAVEILAAAFAERTVEEWRTLLDGFTGQWAVIQHTLEVAEDPQTVANGYVQECHTAAGTPFRLAAAPVRFDDEPAVPRRAPRFNEHGDAILAELGLDWETVLGLKLRGVVA
ncbi:CoA transferase [Frankia sp. CNm7]|uniref:CoA transferase n=1 Tax=Frankia nepalensis TaxID=1836974 RepID=A0A937RMS9_9ACTN|nr:CoA transferase [Frankia nepalensis]MBL7500292.1 CoA transferase [Frankia nepalensis]MBL7511993.1 CoA transferase [Frankia nepalensis]MBL7521186.1 CoA transferase [Frankia nepalensis]MBL7631765.1 CoA transferase [Frankia nepalensis]